MLFIVRFIIVVIYSILVCVFGSLYCLFSPRNPKHVATFGHMFGRLAPVFGLKVEKRFPQGYEQHGKAIYIANHQNNYDMVTASNIVQPPTVTVGKKSLLWVPFFGLLYWLTGNLLIDRNNRAKAHGTIAQVVKHIQKRNISVWMFPEGTRSRGRGLLPFKTGAFHAAIAAGVPIIPVCVSGTSNKINLNRLKNGLVIVEMLPPIDTTGYGKDQIRELAAHCHELMKTKIDELDKEVAEREATGRV
ncbi:MULTISPECIES: 1-acylglycerol-3-phosphate O-acyltransferase [Enterobacteriaceae]|jgi:1-acyl-sn-glycerol-3-phosphate acyltransferase|uniref:1-acyl-sn-glycerol-3-phosphate acyltransferase n=2 Tax=Enterobacteriaceae TaxID=543 RepID=A0ABW1Q7I7_9ENTR|nr:MULTISPECIES: 1-acylglycerol-3-phosphate O-acyltransferase [Phytobacter]AUU87674.1 1-acyl-sn-glycerol-3-phosphate acyltransferase [Enterobacteriaceae bacterium ENNIH3]AUV07031.1 1-acyl-sn-glycerol-3-phosphate acyltransferase [Enterobacteriaceae bacterium ENNIH2]MDU4995607.1 1-acylglycerol-3-phosphate O-acyltransferase [Enterobacteriaceae bacterium]PTA94761.1 1-acyl-sn-glycerol-3-phosphate acyltransferase [Kluyvera sp. Nf5]PWF53676.1 1-acylglycerol-3-phosphate O-acyltransferase [[Kluyvera] i